MPQYALLRSGRSSSQEQERGQDGFTLIELLIVIVILAILALIVVLAVLSATGQSVQASCRSDFKTVETAVEAYKAQVINYPSGSAATAGVAPHTDSESGTPPSTVVGATVGAGVINAGGTFASELLVQGNTSPNSAGAAFASDGPWLKDVPNNNGHYSIFVANDGSGHVMVLDGAGKVAGSGAHSTFSSADCGSVR